MQNSSAAEILQKVRSSKSILVNMDTRVDFDAIASVVVIGKFIQSLGISYTIIHSGKINDTYKGIFSFDEIQQNKDIASIDLGKFDLVIFLDSGLGSHVSMDQNFQIPTTIESINIDHHSTNDMFGKLNYVYHLGSCCTVLHKLFEVAEIPVHNEWLEILAVGLVTDTGFFRYSSVTPHDLRLAAEMVEKGISLSALNAKLNENESLDQMRFKVLALKNLVVMSEKRYAYTTVTLEEIRNSGIDMQRVYASPSELIRNLAGVDFVFAISEKNSDSKYFNISFRSKRPEVDVGEIAGRFGGGGHKGAAGAKMYGFNNVGDVLDIVLATLG